MFTANPDALFERLFSIHLVVAACVFGTSAVPPFRLSFVAFTLVHVRPESNSNGLTVKRIFLRFFPDAACCESSRVGSFNSAPKFNNADLQDDDCDIPSDIKTATNLVNHCKLMRGDNQHELLARSFYKPPNELLANDITDGLRYLSLNSLSESMY